MPEPHVIVFLKAPRLGTVKTRLAATLGEEAALDAYVKMTHTVLAVLSGWSRVNLCYTPDEAEQEIRNWMQPSWHCMPQGIGDLGTRMHTAFTKAKGPAVIIGTDCPSIRIDDFREASKALEEKDLVLGPAKDGGYWLIGLNAPCPALFEGINWSTESVLPDTLARAKAAGLSYYILRELRDVDTEADWKKWSG